MERPNRDAVDTVPVAGDAVLSTGPLRSDPGRCVRSCWAMPGDEPGPIADPALEIAYDGRILGAPKR